MSSKKYCLCDCGNEANRFYVSGHNLKVDGIKTRYKKGIHPSIKTEFKRGKKHPNWKGGTRNHHLTRKIMEIHLRRKLNKKEVIHHIDNNPLNNKFSNLKLFNSHSKHMKYHWKLQKENKIKGRLQGDA